MLNLKHPPSLWFCVFTKVCGGDLPYVSPESLEEKHQFFFREALHVFASTKKMGGQEFCNRYQVKLEKELLEMWESYLKHNEVNSGLFYTLLLSKYKNQLMKVKRGQTWFNLSFVPNHLLFLFVVKVQKPL